MIFQWICDFIARALMAIFAQNLVFTGGYGLCELLRVAARPKKLLMFCGVLSFFSTFGAGVDFLFSARLGFSELNYNFRMLIFVLAVAVLYLAVVLVVFLFNKKSFKQLWKIISLAAFNSAVLVVPFANYKLGNDFGSSVLLGVTAGIGFFFAALLVQSGLKRLHNPDMPPAFRGIPAAFIYIGILSLVFLGIEGRLFMVF